jgi:hypothetical protein
MQCVGKRHFVHSACSHADGCMQGSLCCVQTHCAALFCIPCVSLAEACRAKPFLCTALCDGWVQRIASLAHNDNPRVHAHGCQAASYMRGMYDCAMVVPARRVGDHQVQSICAKPLRLQQTCQQHRQHIPTSAHSGTLPGWLLSTQHRSRWHICMHIVMTAVSAHADAC